MIYRKYNDDDDDDHELFKAFLALITAGNTVRDSYNRKAPTNREQELKLCWMKLCSSNNHYTVAPFTRYGNHLQMWLIINLISVFIVRSNQHSVTTIHQRE